MQRTTVPSGTYGMDASRSFDVYRSLPVSALASARNASSSEGVLAVENKPEQPRTSANSRNERFEAPLVPVPIAGLEHNAIWMDSVDLDDMKERLNRVCSRCEFRRAPSTCQFVCTAEAEDGCEWCNFVINIWSVPEDEPGSHGRYILNYDRCAGCPYFFKSTLAKAFDVPKCKKNADRLFRPLKLPECYCDEGKGMQHSCVERATALATSDVYEQRIQGVEVLASFCSEKNPNFASLFRAVDGPRRIQSLQNDSDCWVRKAAQKILDYCS